MTEPLVSIVTPSYNEVDFVEETVNSICDQTYSNIEHIVVDGGSDDGTIEILKEYEPRYNMRVINQEGNGLYDAIATGLDDASGKYGAWLNANDIYLPWAISIAVDELEEDGTRWITGRSATIDDEGNLQYISKLQKHYRQAWIRRGWYHGKGLGWFCQPSMFWDMSLWEMSDGFPDHTSLAGEHFLWRNFAEYAELVSVNSLLGVHRIHDNQLSEEMDQWYDEVEVGNIPKFLRLIKANDIYSLYKVFRS